MNFLIEDTDFVYVKMDTLIALKAINNSRIHTYSMMQMRNFYKDTGFLSVPYEKEHFPKEYMNSIPIGSIEFIQQFYKTFYNIERENSIEIPKVLRKEKYLKRFYLIDTLDNIPNEGEYFFKDATEERSLSFVGTKEALKKEIVNNYNNEVKNHLFVCSELLDVESEIRFYVIRGEIKQISFYKGKCGIAYDHCMVEEIIQCMNKESKAPKSYSFDVMVTSRGTALLEVHSFTGLGIHNYMIDDSILEAYIDADEYYRKGNFIVEKG